MAGKSPVTATDGQKAALQALGHCADRAGADRARALLVTLDGWTSARIAQAFGVPSLRGARGYGYGFGGAISLGSGSMP
jgi:hypothetical protein